MKSYQNAAGRIQDFVVLLDQMKKSVADGDLPPRAVETLKRELLRQKRKAIELFMERIDDLFEFEPAESPAARPKTTGRISA